MPSGSHGGHSGSHGGSHSSSSHSHSSSYGRSGSYRHHHRLIHFRYGRSRYVVRSGASAFITFLLVIMFFAIFGLFATWIMQSEANRNINQIKADYFYYQNMILDAKENPEELIVEGTVITKFYNDIAKKWYVTYFFVDDSGFTVNGYTFSVYTAEEANNFKRGDKIELAVDGRPMDSQTDSIPLDYADMPIEKDGEYVTFTTQRNAERIAMIVCGCLVGGIILLSVVIALTNKVKVQERTNTPLSRQTEIDSDYDVTDPILEPIKDSKTYCEYCGAEISANETKCPNCRSKLGIK